MEPLFFALAFAWLPFSLALYQNFTVGGSLGWTSNPSVNYTAWAAGKDFSLGDYLIFNYSEPDYNVIWTYNETVFESCDYLDSNDDDYQVWGEAGKTNVSEIPLVQTGWNYFFCGVNNSLLCEQGMKFAVNVSFGDGLPSNLAYPPPPPPSPATPTGAQPSNTSVSGTRISYHNYRDISAYAVVFLMVMLRF